MDANVLLITLIVGLEGVALEGVELAMPVAETALHRGKQLVL